MAFSDFFSDNTDHSLKICLYARFGLIDNEVLIIKTEMFFYLIQIITGIFEISNWCKIAVFDYFHFIHVECDHQNFGWIFSLVKILFLCKYFFSILMEYLGIIFSHKMSKPINAWLWCLILDILLCLISTFQGDCNQSII